MKIINEDIQELTSNEINEVFGAADGNSHTHSYEGYSWGCNQNHGSEY